MRVLYFPSISSSLLWRHANFFCFLFCVAFPASLWFLAFWSLSTELCKCPPSSIFLDQVANHLRLEITEAEASSMFDELDVDRSGTLSKQVKHACLRVVVVDVGYSSALECSDDYSMLTMNMWIWRGGVHFWWLFFFLICALPLLKPNSNFVSELKIESCLLFLHTRLR